MRILVVHNRYAMPGGEDAVFEQESDLLERKGHEVRRHEVSNRGLDSEGLLHAAVECVWSRRQAAAMVELVASWHPDIVHIHNVVARLSPAIHRAACRQGATVVQTLHNFRLLCPNGLLFRGGRHCDLCQNRWFKWPSIWHACYRGSPAASATLAFMLALHKAAGTWDRVHGYIALTNAARRMFIRGGLPERRLHVKPNFVLDPYPRTPGSTGERQGVVFVGRFSEEKGILALVTAWQHVVTDEPLTLIGDGPLMPLVRETMRSDPRIRATGWLAREVVQHQLSEHRAVVIPSQCSEAFSLLVVEAYANGRPVIASRTPTFQELVAEGETGLLVPPGDTVALSLALGRVLSERAYAEQMGENARKAYEARYTPKKNYDQLMTVYECARAERDRML